MYEQYTDKQIVETLIPKLNKATSHDWNDLFEYPKVCADMIKAISLAYRSGYVRGQLGRSFIIGGKKADEKKAKESVNAFKAGNKVKFLGLGVEDEEALNNRRFYPPVNTVGKIVKLDSDYCFVRWPKGIVSGDEVWAYRNIYLEKVIEHWVPVNGNNIQKGDSVRYIGKYGHKNNPKYYPAKDVVGKVIKVYSDWTCYIQWSKGTTSQGDRWRAAWGNLEVLLCE